MPDKSAMERAEKDRREGKSASTQAGEFVREEIHHIREGKHGARSTRQAIAIGLSEARRAGVALPPPKKGSSSEEIRRKSERDLEIGKQRGKQRRELSGEQRGEQRASRVSGTRAEASLGALEKESGAAASPAALAQQARAAASKRSPAERSAAARKGAQTKGVAGRSAAAAKAARTRAAKRVKKD